MEIHKLAECGYLETMIGVALSYHVPTPETPLDEIAATVTMPPSLARTLSAKDRGHNKFLEAIETWWLVRAPLTWWQQFDTFRHAMEAVDESVVQSESTMHTLTKRHLRQADFERPIDAEYLQTLNRWIDAKDFLRVSDGLPRSFLQVRCLKLNYQVLRNIVLQRRAHKLHEWHVFCNAVLAQVTYPELLPGARIDDE